MAYHLSETEILAQPSDFVNELFTQDWYDNERSAGDAGYSDTFKTLKHQMDYNYTRYKNQLRELIKKTEDLNKEKHHQIITTLIIMFFPLFLFILSLIFTHLDNISHFFAICYLVTYIATFPAILIFDFLLLPGAARDLMNCLYRSSVLNKKSTPEQLKKKNPVITFEDEKDFLKKTISKYDRFYKRIETEGIDQKGGKMRLGPPDELTDKDKEILNEMRSMTIFKEYYASSSELTRRAGYSWILIGFGIFVGVVVVVASVMLKHNM